MAKAMLFIDGTALSSSVWKRNVGGVSRVTCLSFESDSTVFGSGSGPSRFRREPEWVTDASNVMTG